MSVRSLLFRIFIPLLCLLAAGTPLLLQHTGHLPLTPLVSIVILSNFAAICFGLTFYFLRQEFSPQIREFAIRLGIAHKGRPAEYLLPEITAELERREAALSFSSTETAISTPEELGITFEKIVSCAARLLHAESAEIALFDEASGTYHSGFSLGKAFAQGAEDMLKTSPEAHILLQPISFAGAVYGCIRVGKAKGQAAAAGDREILQILALQSSLALMNAEFTRELLRMKRSAEESVRAKTGFLANISHEIRGPLNSILNAAGLLLDNACGPLSAEQTDVLKIIKRSGAHLSDLISDVLEYAKLESGKLVSEKTVLNAGDALQEAVGLLRKEAEAKQHTLHLSVPDEILQLQCDKRHLRQMLLNLLSNAIKYTPQGGQIFIRADAAPGNKIRLSIKDSGIGIDPAMQHKIFSPFERLPHTYAAAQSGSGLGLSLTKRLAELNGGKIDFTSAAGKGSEFRLLFSRLEYSGLTAEERAPAITNAAGEKIVLLESDETERSLTERMLSHRGFSVRSISTVQDLQPIISQGHADLLIIDNHFLEQQGASMLSEQTGKIPVLLLSSRAFAFDVEKYLKQGIDRCLTKPVAGQELCDVCLSLIRAAGELRTEQGEHGTEEKVIKNKGIDDIWH